MRKSVATGSSSSRIQKKSVDELVRAVDNGRGEYAFLIGAGTSKPAGIPTSNELIEKWQEDVYEYIEPKEDFGDWVEKTESHIGENEGRYGFWFEKAYPAPASRKEYIRELVEDETPSFGIIILASMMSEGIVPLTLTTNFDDLLFDAFYLFLEDKPLLVDHDAIAPQFKLTSDRPSIVKLHGDYLYDNLKNTEDETSELEANMHKTMSQSLAEYGLVVVGYGGGDDSIMDVLKNEPISDHGLFWCGRGDKEDLSDEVKSLLKEKDDAYFVSIEGSEELFAKFWQGLDGFSPPQPDEIRERADQRAGKLRRAMEERGEQASGDEAELLEAWETVAEAIEYDEKNEYQKAAEIYEKVLEEVPELLVARNNYARLLTNKLDRPEEAEEHFQQILDIDPELAAAHNNYALLLHEELDRPEEAEKHYQWALDIDPEDLDTHYNYGNLLARELGCPEEAEEHYQRVFDIDPEHLSTHINYGIVLKEHLNRPEEAEEHFQRALDIDPEDFNAHYNYGNLLKDDLERPEEAEEQFQRALDINSEDPDTHINYGLLLHEELNRPEEAEKHYQQALDIDPELARAHYQYGRLLEDEFNRLEEAKEHFDYAAKLDSKYEDISAE